MINLSNVPNPDEKIKEVLKQAIKNRENRIKKINSQIDSIKKQDADGNIFVPLKQEPEFNVKYVGTAIITIIGDILYGFGKGVELMKEGIDKQTGGQSTTSSNKKEISKENVKNNTNKLSQVIDKAKNKANYQSLGVDANDTLNKSYAEAQRLGKTAFKTGLKWTEEFINMMIDLSLEMTGESKIGDTPWQELSPQLNKKLVLMAGLLKELSENPATREAVKEIAQAIAVTMIEIMKEIKPELDKVTDQALVMLDDVSEKAIRGAAKTGLSVIQAFVAEVPFWGGIVDFIIAIGKGFNAVMETYKVFVTKSSPMMVDTAKGYVKTEDTIERGKDRITNAYDKASDTLKESKDVGKDVGKDMEKEVSKVDSIEKNKTPMKGGMFSPDKKLKNKILKGGKRLKRTMKLFQDTVPRVKYSHKNRIHKNDKSRRKKRKHKSRRL